MKKIELTKTYVEGDTIHYQVREEKGLGLLQKEVVDLFICYHGDEHYDCDLSKAPNSILSIPVSLYMLPITYFFDDVELVIPEMDSVLYQQLPAIYDAYSKIYGPFKQDWRGKLTVNKVIENAHIESSEYDKIVFFSGGVDACHAGISNPGKRSLLVSVPSIEREAINEGPLREQKFRLIKEFSRVVNSNWLLISNNFNSTLFNEKVIYQCLSKKRVLSSHAYNYDGWGGIRYLANICSVAPYAYLAGVSEMIMGSSYEQIEDNYQVNLDGTNPDLTDSIKFAYTEFSEQDGPLTRRSQKVKNIVEWCKQHHVKTRLWACFTNGSTQCSYCVKCCRTQLNLLGVCENPKDWGFDNFSEKKFAKFIKSFKYNESNVCWLWDIIDIIQDDKIYPYCNELLHWLKSIGYKKYHKRATEKARPTIVKRLFAFSQYPHYVKIIFSKLIGK